MTFGKSLGIAALLGASLVSSAKAEMVQFVTDGVFSQSGTSEYNSDGVDILFNGSTDNNVDTPSLASFGNFVTTGTTADSPTALTGTFTLTITQVSGPNAGDMISFVANLGGSLSATSSNAFAAFLAPLTQNIGSTLYQILSADSGTMGNINMSPPTTNNGTASISGFVSSNAVPEPASVVMMGIGGISLLGVMGLRKRASN